jgi:CheY-like chemotaxis protein
MRYSGMNVLLVGEDFHVAAQSLSDPLHRWGFRCHLAGTMRATLEFLKCRGSDLVLSQMHLPDGTGFNLLSTLTGLPITAFLCLPVEDSCLWLRAIDAGRNCWGEENVAARRFRASARGPGPAATCRNAGPGIARARPRRVASTCEGDINSWP